MSKTDLPIPSWVPRFERGDPFLEAWFAEGSINERRRVMLRSRIGALGLATKLHDLITDYLFIKHNAFHDELPTTLQALSKTTIGSPVRTAMAEAMEGLIAKEFVGLMTSPDAPKMLRELAQIVDVFPVSKGSIYFGDNLSVPDWFKPTLQDGLKAVMLGAFLHLVEKRPLTRESLPTIGELDSIVREKWKWAGDDKELRDARRELGLSGLPCGKSGRPKKQRGKK